MDTSVTQIMLTCLTMTRLFHASIPHTLSALVDDLSVDPGATAEIWSFDSPTVRAAATEALAARGIAAHGVSAHVRSAYKPLIFAFQDIDLDAVDRLTIVYPTVAGIEPQRFRLECYPITDIAAPRPVVFTAGAPQDPAGLLTYTVLLHGPNGTRTIEVAAPNAMITDHTGAQVLANTGWLRVTAPDGGVSDQTIETEQQQAFRQAMACLAEHPWPAGQGPYFDRLTLTVAAPFYDHPLPVPGDHISTAEAMHEELYFGALEVFRRAANLPPGDRTLQPGQIVPRIITRDGPAEITVTMDTAKPPAADPPQPVEWATAAAPPSPTAVKAALDALGGTAFAATTRQGRPVWSTFVDGIKPGLVISANQHGNETTGIIGALRAARQVRDTGTAFAVSPLENPDGYALYRDLCAGHPTHIHHAARYTASGNDLEYAARGYENEVRHWAKAQTGAAVHLNLHGYPGHEWAHPFTGYQPRGFEQWTIPKGFLLILRAKPGWQAKADDLLSAVTDDLNAYPALVAFNRRQIARYRQYLPDADLTLHGAIPVYTPPARDDALFPITLITEAPDEGVVDPNTYVLFHTAHMRAVLAAARCLAALPA